MVPRGGIDTVEKRKIPIPHQESNPRTPIIQPIASHYTDWATPALTLLGKLCNKVKVNVNVKLFLCSTKHHTTKMHGWVEIQLQALPTLAVDEGEWPAQRPGRFTPVPMDRRLYIQ
jgi:hypothetical protein